MADVNLCPHFFLFFIINQFRVIFKVLYSIEILRRINFSLIHRDADVTFVLKIHALICSTKEHISESPRSCTRLLKIKQKENYLYNNLYFNGDTHYNYSHQTHIFTIYEIWWKRYFSSSQYRFFAPNLSAIVTYLPVKFIT